MASPYLINPEDIKAGFQALQSGALSPQQAMQAFKFSPWGDQSPEVNRQIAQTSANNAASNQEYVMGQVGATVPSLPSVPSAPAKSGKSYKVDAKNASEHKTTTNKTTALDQDEFAIMDKRARDQLTDLMRGQSDLEGMLKMEMERKQPVSFTRPLAILADALNGGNLASKIPVEESESDRATRLLGYAQKIQQDRKSIVDAYLNSIQKQKGGTVINLNGATQSAGATNESKDPTSQGFKGINLSNQFNNYSQRQLKKNDEAADSINEIANEVASGNPIDDNRLAILRSKLDAGGRPNIAEVQLEAGDRALIEMARQSVQRALTGKITEHNRELVLQSLQTIAEVKQKERDMYIAKLRSQGGSQYAQSKEQLDASFPEGYARMFTPAIDLAKGYRSKRSAPAANGPQAPAQKTSSGFMTPEEFAKSKGWTQ